MSAKRDVILETRDLKKNYHAGGRTLEVLRGVNLRIPRGAFAAIVGASGTGKSTLLHLMGLLNRASSGEVLYEGNDISRLGGAAKDRMRLTSFGFVFQLYHLLPEFNVLENALLPPMISTSVLVWPARKKKMTEKAKALLDRLGLGHRLKHRPRQLSGGEQQRVAIARALINDPAVVLCDEPTGNLDPHTGESIIEMLHDINRQEKKTMVLVTHDAQLAARADVVWHLVEGKIKM